MGGTLISRRSRGFSLIEALVSIVIVGLMATAVSRAIVDSRVALSNDEARNQANYKASRVIDSLRAMGVSGVSDTTKAAVVCADSRDHVAFACTTNVSTLGTATSGRPASKRVAVDVHWKIRKAPHSVHVEGVIE
ncbi:MAG: type II secretion system protein [Fibrobacterales bacterium]|nr:type II secretion system protein [Fibrobacterales bacterium]